MVICAGRSCSKYEIFQCYIYHNKFLNWADTENVLIRAIKQIEWTCCVWIFFKKRIGTFFLNYLCYNKPLIQYKLFLIKIQIPQIQIQCYDFSEDLLRYFKYFCGLYYKFYCKCTCAAHKENDFVFQQKRLQEAFSGSEQILS